MTALIQRRHRSTAWLWFALAFVQCCQWGICPGRTPLASRSEAGDDVNHPAMHRAVPIVRSGGPSGHLQALDIRWSLRHFLLGCRTGTHGHSAARPAPARLPQPAKHASSLALSDPGLEGAQLCPARRLHTQGLSQRPLVCPIKLKRVRRETKVAGPAGFYL